MKHIKGGILGAVGFGATAALAGYAFAMPPVALVLATLGIISLGGGFVVAIVTRRRHPSR